MTLQYVQVNVDRNKSGTPMPEQVWHAYIWDIASNIITSSLDGFPYPFERLEGTVARFDEGGQLVEEDTLHISVMIDIDADALRRALAATAKKYGQDAIALILGSELIEGN